MAPPEQLTATIRQILSDQLPILLKQSQDSGFNFAIAESQGIAPKHQLNLQDLDKVPDIVKSLHDFSRDPAEFGSWKKSVDRILETYAHTVGTAKYFGIYIQFEIG